MNKTTEALKLAEEALEELHYSSGTVKAVTLYKSALAAIREALADHSGDSNEMVAEPELLEIVEAVAHIGVDFGYGKFQLDQSHIEKARAAIRERAVA